MVFGISLWLKPKETTREPDQKAKQSQAVFPLAHGLLIAG